MTPADKRRLARTRELQKAEEVGTTGFLLRLLDEATAERDIARDVAEWNGAAANAAHREGFFLCRQKAENAVIESSMRDHERRLLRQKIANLPYPDPLEKRARLDNDHR